MGCAAAAALAARGARALILERVAPGHLGGSSHGESRVIRLSNFENPAYGPIIVRAAQLWEGLETEPGEVFLRTGVLECGPEDGALIRDTIAAAVAGGFRFDRLSPEDVHRRFPAVSLPEGWAGVFQGDGGLIRADNALRRLLDTAHAHGATLETAKALRVEQRGDHVEVLTDQGVIEAKAAIVTAGGWIADLIPELTPHLQLTRQVLGWFEPVEPDLVTPDALPVFLFGEAEGMVYGFPDFLGLGVKAACHEHGRRLDSAADARQDATDDDLAQVMAVLRDRLKPAAGPVRSRKTCIYTNTPDTEFIIGRRPGHPQVVFASACSGHGFKFASAIGEGLAQMALGEATTCDFGAFTFDRFRATSPAAASS
jgi:sarcosine oxidase